MNHTLHEEKTDGIIISSLINAHCTYSSLWEIVQSNFLEEPFRTLILLESMDRKLHKRWDSRIYSLSDALPRETSPVNTVILSRGSCALG